MRKQFMKKRTYRPTLERLEDRTLPATWGMAWPNPQRVSVSFVPDGTQVFDSQSSLFQTLNSQTSSSVWESTILQALDTWAVNTNINLAVVKDGGQPIGTPGAIQGDTRFGDIRIAAQPLGSQVVAITSGIDLTAGTISGDMILNSSDFGTGSAGLYDLFTVTLHEAGHCFGLPDQSTDPTSVMYAQYNGIRTGLSAADISQIQSIYGGSRKADSSEGTSNNDSFAAATSLTVASQVADISSPTDADYFKFIVPSYTSGSLTVQVQGANVSLLIPQLTVLNSLQQIVATSVSSDPFNNNVSLTINNVTPGATYYFEVQGAGSGVFGIGAYRLQVNSSALSPLMIANYNTVYNNSSSTMPAIASNSSISAALNLEQAPYIGSQGYNRAIQSALSSSFNTAFYKVVAQPTASGAASTLVATVTAINGGALNPVLTVLDQNGNLVNASILVNDSGTYVVQVVNATPGATYFVEVNPEPLAGANVSGTYLLGVDYVANPIVLTQFATNTLSGTSNQNFYSMTVSQTQITHFVLSGSAVGATVATAVRMSIYDQNGTVIFTLDAIAGQTVSSNIVLVQGTYTIRFVAATIDGSALSPFTYNLLGETLTDPIDAYPLNDPSLPPPPPVNPTPVVVANTNPPPLPNTDNPSPWTPPPPPPPTSPPPPGVTGP
jgi:matrixin